MHELKVIGVESGSLLLADDEGEEFRIAVDDALHARLRQASAGTATARKLSPKDIQAQIRAGMSADDVAAITGASIDDIRRFEGPVLAEREFVVQSALAVPVRRLGDSDPLTPKPSFGDVIRGRLVDGSARDERWASWKEQGGGWIVKLTFTANQVDHDARWSYDPKRSALVPLNSEAEALSAEGDLPAPLIPRLRAVSSVDAAGTAESSRFDSGAFVVDHEFDTPESAASEPAEPSGSTRGEVDDDARTPARATRSGNQTADLLEALRRRRGERDPMDLEMEEPRADHPTSGAVRLVDVPLDTATLDLPVPAKSSPSSGAPPVSLPAKSARRGRASMPSWDDIVFGARPDED